MYISRLILKNWKNFQSVDIDFQQRVFLVGPNASGKSNLLDAIRFLRDLAKIGGGLQQAVEQRGGVSKIRCLSARTHSDIELQVDISDDISKEKIWSYKLAFNQFGGGIQRLKAKLKYEYIKNFKTNWFRERPSDKDNKDTHLLEYTHLEQPTQNSEFRDISDFFSGIQYLHIIPHLVRSSKKILLSDDQEDFFGRDFIERLNKYPKKTRSSFLKKIEKALKIAVPKFHDLEIVPDKMGVPHLQAIYHHWRAQGAKQWEDQFSDGTLRLIGLLWALQDGFRPVLLEEPELSLHNAIVSRLPEIITLLQKRKSGIRQVFLSSHSYELLSNKGINGEETILLEPTDEGTIVKTASSDEEIKILLDTGMTIADSVIPATSPEYIDQLTLGL